MFVGRRQNGTIETLWVVKQFDGQEELPDDHPDVLAGPVKLPLPARFLLDESERQATKDDGPIMALINQTRTEWRSWAGTNFPTLTAPERTRLGDLFWVVSVGVRQRVRNGGN